MFSLHTVTKQKKKHYFTWKEWIYFNYYCCQHFPILSGQTFHLKFHSLICCVIFAIPFFIYSLYFIYNNVTGIVPVDRHLLDRFIQFAAIGMDLWIYYMHHHHHHCKGTVFAAPYNKHDSVWNMKCRAWNSGPFYDNIFMSEILFMFFIGFFTFSFSCSMAYGLWANTVNISAQTNCYHFIFHC